MSNSATAGGFLFRPAAAFTVTRFYVLPHSLVVGEEVYGDLAVLSTSCVQQFLPL